jgi:uncharacterized membrane protein HdeD (DUF308 family)
MNMDSKDMGMARSGVPRTYGMLGILCAFLSLNFLSEIFGSAAIIFGAFQTKRSRRFSGIVVVILGIASLLAGIFLTAYPLLYNLIIGY